MAFIVARAWSWAPYDCLAVALWYLGDNEGAQSNAERALAYAPQNERLKNNLRIILGG